MSKTKKLQKKTVEDKLTEIGLTLAEAKNWLEQANSSCVKQKNRTSSEPSTNIKFVPAQNTEQTKVSVLAGREEIELNGVVRATLDYNPELGFPTLHLEIVNPVISNY